MRFWGVTALRYIKSEEITPVELMTANELGSQLTPSANSGRSERELQRNRCKVFFKPCAER